MRLKRQTLLPRQKELIHALRPSVRQQCLGDHALNLAFLQRSVIAFADQLLQLTAVIARIDQMAVSRRTDRFRTR